MSQAKAEKRDFRMHPDLLFSVIKSQAGTRSKAFLELVMNSIDAGSDRVYVNFDRKSFQVIDTGKGFTSRQEIELFFETFGQPHTKDDATYGKFRMGRGQIFSFARNTWLSGDFRMDVDIKGRGLEYDLHDGQPKVSGCSISGEFYDEMSSSELMLLTKEMDEMCKYAPTPVICNGKNISVDLSKEKWTHIDNDAYYRLDGDKNYLSVYNRGVLVRAYPAGNYGCGGLIISKEQLEVNFARNDILLSQCDVWRRISSVIKSSAAASAKKSPAKNESWREMMCDKLTASDFVSMSDMYEFFSEASIFTDIAGKHYTFDSLRSAISRLSCKIFIAGSSSPTGVESKLQTEKLAIVLAKKALNRFKSGITLEQIIESAITSIDTVYAASTAPRMSSYSIESLKRNINEISAAISTPEKLMAENGVSDDIQFIDDNKLTKSEKEIFSVISKASEAIHWGLSRHDIAREPRKLKVIESQVTNTDTNNDFILLNRKYLSVSGYDAFAFFCTVGAKLLHEYLHDKDSLSGVHDHSAEFYEFYERCSADVIGQFVSRSVAFYGKAVVSGKISKIKTADKKLVDALDQFGTDTVSNVAFESQVKALENQPYAF